MSEFHKTLATVQYLIPYADGKRITAKQIYRMAGINPEMVRKCVNILRQDGIPVCSDRNGYFISANPKCVEATIDSLRNRVGKMQAAIDGLEKWRSKNEGGAKVG